MFTIDRGSGKTQYEVQVNGVDRVVYCMQFDFLWPITSEGYYSGNKTNYREATAEEFLMDEALTETVRKALFAGYPYNGVGAFDELYALFGPAAAEAAGYITQDAIWYLVKDSVPNNEHFVPGHYDEIFGDAGQNAYDRIIEYATGSDVVPDLPEDFEPAVEGIPTFIEKEDYFITPELSITSPDGFSVLYLLNLPDCVTPFDKDGNEIFGNYDFVNGEIVNLGYSISGGEVFRLKTASVEDALKGEISISGSVKIPTDVKQYMTDESGLGTKEWDDPNKTESHNFQTMLSIAINENKYDLTVDFVENSIDITGEKTWLGGSLEARPDNIVIRLKANGTEVRNKTVSPDPAGNWKWNFPGVPKYDEDGEIEYTITEDDVENFNSTVDGFNVINEFDPGETEIRVSKTWQDDDDNDGIRPDSVKVYLVEDGVKNNEKYIELKSDSRWEGFFNELPALNDKGEKIVYSVEEEEVDGYESDVEGDPESGFIICNTHESVTFDISVTKSWANDNPDNRPERIIIELLVDGEVQDEAEVRPTADGVWFCQFKDLRKFDNGREIVYEINEVDVDGYRSEITGSVDEGFEVTNTLITPPGEDTPDTGDDSQLLFYIAMMILSLMGIIVNAVIIKRGSKGKNAR